MNKKELTDLIRSIVREEIASAIAYNSVAQNTFNGGTSTAKRPMVENRAPVSNNGSKSRSAASSNSQTRRDVQPAHQPTKKKAVSPQYREPVYNESYNGNGRYYGGEDDDNEPHPMIERMYDEVAPQYNQNQQQKRNVQQPQNQNGFEVEQNPFANLRLMETIDPTDMEEFNREAAYLDQAGTID